MKYPAHMMIYCLSMFCSNYFLFFLISILSFVLFNFVLSHSTVVLLTLHLVMFKSMRKLCCIVSLQVSFNPFWYFVSFYSVSVLFFLFVLLRIYANILFCIHQKHIYLYMELEMAMKKPPARIISQKPDDCVTSVRDDHCVLLRGFIQLACDITCEYRRNQDIYDLGDSDLTLVSF